MSKEDADIIRRAYEVWNEAGPAAVTAEFWAEDAVYREGPGWPDAGIYRGRAAALERMQSLIDLLGPIEVRLDFDRRWRWPFRRLHADRRPGRRRRALHAIL